MQTDTEKESLREKTARQTDRSNSKIYLDDRNVIQEFLGDLKVLRANIDDKISMFEGLTFSTKFKSMESGRIMKHICK